MFNSHPPSESCTSSVSRDKCENNLLDGQCHEAKWFPTDKLLWLLYLTCDSLVQKLLLRSNHGFSLRKHKPMIGCMTTICQQSKLWQCNSYQLFEICNIIKFVTIGLLHFGWKQGESTCKTTQKHTHFASHLFPASRICILMLLTEAITLSGSANTMISSF